jgi:hypothetical protein
VVRRAGLVALLIYVTLDLSLPAMPGAFVFDADDSVESLQSARARVVSGLDTVPNEDAGCRGVPSPVRIDMASAPRPPERAMPPRRTHRLPRATLVVVVATDVIASATEDPH